MPEKIAVVYWCDTTGHAARSIPIASEIRDRGYELVMAGGGRGAKFVEMNGFELPDLPDLEVFQEEGFFVTNTLFDTIPSALKRWKSMFSWLREEEPDKVVTDDIFCLLSCAAMGIDFYRIENWKPEMFDFPVSTLWKIYNKFTLTFGEKIILTSLWPWEDTEEGFERVGPLAQVGDEKVEPYDVLLMPGSFGEEFGEIRQELEQKGYDTKMVGADDWETKASMTPYTEAAEVTLCCGFSSMADSVVGGAHCIVYPHLNLQHGIAGGIEKRNLEGMETVGSKEKALEALERCMEQGCKKPDYENGSSDFVDAIEK